VGATTVNIGEWKLFAESFVIDGGIMNTTAQISLDNGIQSNLEVGTANLFVDVSTGSVGVSNSAPTHTLDVGSNLYVEDTGSSVLTVLGNAVVSNKLTVQGFRIAANEYNGLQAVTDTNNETSNPIVITNADNSTSTSTGALTLTNGGLGVLKDIHAGGSLTLASDLTVDTNTLKVDVGQNRVGILTTSPGFPLDVHGAANVGALTTTSVSGDGSGLTNILSSSVNDFSSNVTRIAALESGDLTIGGEKTFSSNLEVGTAHLFVDTTTGNVGIGSTIPTAKLDLVGGNISGYTIPYATGGTITTYGNYRVHTFTGASGTFVVTKPGLFEVLIVGGGGGGGHRYGGGGGAGGLVNSTHLFESGTYTVTVGAGGAASSRGGDSSIISDRIKLYAYGGGQGGQYNTWYPVNAINGGSGGGGGSPGSQTGSNSWRYFTGGLSTSGQGSNGGTGFHYSGVDASGGGGGGAGQPGENATTAAVPGAGGDGKPFNFVSSTTVYYAGGGGGGNNDGPGKSGGLGGGGNGAAGNDSTGTLATSGTINTGGGGGGGGSSTSGAKSGGSGIVLIRYFI
jgi:hypothetical protein